MAVYYLKEHSVDIPELLIDEDKGYISIIGSSYPEDIMDAYEDFLLKLNALNIVKGQDFLCKIELNILGSASMRILHEVFLLLDEFNDAGAKIIVNWIYEYEDEDMEEVGESFQELFDFEFQIVEKK